MPERSITRQEAVALVQQALTILTNPDDDPARVVWRLVDAAWLAAEVADPMEYDGTTLRRIIGRDEVTGRGVLVTRRYQE